MILGDIVTGNTKDLDVRRAAELRNTIVSLGPFFIKLGQALSIRPDILSPRAMVELQQLCDKVPCFPNELAMRTIEEELGRSPAALFSTMSADPVAAASLGQVYRAKLRATGDEVAVKVQRPFVLETVSLDLYLVRKFGMFLRNFPDISSRIDLVSLLDEFAQNFYQELDYQNECRNGLKIADDMRKLPMVVIPKNYPDYTSRRVHTAQWVDGEKLSQSVANDVGALVNLGVITYLTQLLDTGFFHADPHPGNMLRTPDGKLVILDFGLMTKITDDQKYGMIEAIAHLIHRDYDEIGNDFVKLDFIPKGVDTRPIVPALARVFDAALSGGGAKSINFQELAADLAEITFKFPFRIPPYFALIIRAISVLEGIALVGNPDFAIVDEAYPYIAKRLLTDDAPRLRGALRYMLYGKENVLDADRLIDILQALEKFVAVKDFGDGKAFKVDGKRGNIQLGRSSTMTATLASAGAGQRFSKPTTGSASSAAAAVAEKKDSVIVREALKFFFSKEGEIFRVFLSEEICNGVDAISRDAARELIYRLGIQDAIPTPMRPFLRALAPKLTAQDKGVVDSIVKLVSFLVDGSVSTGTGGMTSPLATSSSSSWSSMVIESAARPENQEKLRQLLPVLREYAPNMRDYGLLIVSMLVEKATARLLKATADAIFGEEDPRELSSAKDRSRQRSSSSSRLPSSTPSPINAVYVNNSR
jgi:aarF domain-containing kinase